MQYLTLSNHIGICWFSCTWCQGADMAAH